MPKSGTKRGVVSQSKIWFHFLENMNDEAVNREKIINYLFDQFRESPDAFYKFILYFKKTLRKTRSIAKRKLLARRYLEILTFFCERYSLFQIKTELDDYCFKILNPQRYEELSKLVGEYRRKANKVISTVIKKFYLLLKKHNFRFEINGRYKTLYSIHRKLARMPESSPLSLRDIFAFRIIVKNDSIADCFKILDLLHDKFNPVAIHFKDYISIPKINGYQSLHISLSDVVSDLNLLVEVQIRTKSMHETAEKGFASHWVYSRSKKSTMISEKSKKMISYLISTSAEDAISTPVYFLSYKGDVFTLPEGSTALDFAYQIHSGFGNQAKSAIVNGKLKELNYKLKEADIIQIRKGRKNAVCEDWLKYTNNKYTINKIHDAIRK
ncbi:TGS domain-containing protein [Pseudomonadota bacterium]